MIVDAWAQHPTLRVRRDPACGSAQPERFAGLASVDLHDPMGAVNAEAHAGANA